MKVISVLRIHKHVYGPLLKVRTFWFALYPRFASVVRTISSHITSSPVRSSQITRERERTLFAKPLNRQQNGLLSSYRLYFLYLSIHLVVRIPRVIVTYKLLSYLIFFHTRKHFASDLEYITLINIFFYFPPRLLEL